MKILNLKYCIGTLAASLLLAACASDELTDGTVQDLPEGMYPLQIAGMSLTAESSAEPWGADSPQTRVSENTTDGNSSVWDGGEEITVQLNGTMADGTPYTAEGQYTLGDDKQTLTPVSGKELYWRSTSAGTVTAWCSPTASDNTVNLSNQSNGLAYVLKAEASNVTYNTSPSLSFTHQLAKIRVALGDGSTADLFNDDAKVEVYNYPSCTVSNGTINISNLPQADYITMRKVTYGDKKYYEANVVPNGTVSKFRITLKDKVAKEMTIGSSVALAAAKLHLITLTVTNAKITLGNNPVNINDNGEYTISGTGTQTITINGTATVIIQDVSIKTSNQSAIKITKGTATIKLKGTNKIESINSERICAAGIELSGTDSHVVIEGSENASLTVTADYGNPAIGSGNGGKGGNITIQNANITARAINTLGYGCGAAIGSGSSWIKGEAHIGIITIINSDITASVGSNMNSSAAVIGTGDSTYSNEKNSCDGINITLKAGQTKTQFLSNLTGTYNVQVGAGSNYRGGTNTCGSINWYNSDGSPAN